MRIQKTKNCDKLYLTVINIDFRSSEMHLSKTMVPSNQCFGRFHVGYKHIIVATIKVNIPLPVLPLTIPSGEQLSAPPSKNTVSAFQISYKLLSFTLKDS